MRKLLVVVAVTLGCVSLLAAAWAEPQRGQNDSRTLTGHVFGSHDEPLQKAIVYLKNTKTLAIKTYITEPDGSYRFPALATNVDYEVYAEHQGARSDTKTLSGFDSRKQATITLKIKAK
jgi:carboxypeptidase family protein